MSNSSEVYRLYGSPDSANLVVRMLLEELGQSYEYVPLNRLKSEQKSAEYRKLNPLGLIPVLEVPGQDAPVFETGAILLLLADSHGVLAPKPGAPERGQFLKWLFFISNTLHSDLRIFFKPERYCQESCEIGAFSEVLISRVDRHFEQLDAQITRSGGPYMLGEDLTCLDFYVAACARWAQLYGQNGRWSPVGLPGLMRSLTAMEQRSAVSRACQLEHIDERPFVDPHPVDLPGITA